MKESLLKYEESFPTEKAAKSFKEDYKNARANPLSKYSVEQLIEFAKIECYGINYKDSKEKSKVLYKENDKQHQLISEIIVDKLIQGEDFESNMKVINTTQEPTNHLMQKIRDIISDKYSQSKEDVKALLDCYTENDPNREKLIEPLKTFEDKAYPQLEEKLKSLRYYKAALTEIINPGTNQSRADALLEQAKVRLNDGDDGLMKILKSIARTVLVAASNAVCAVASEITGKPYKGFQSEEEFAIKNANRHLSLHHISTASKEASMAGKSTAEVATQSPAEPLSPSKS